MVSLDSNTRKCLPLNDTVNTSLIKKGGHMQVLNFTYLTTYGTILF